MRKKEAAPGAGRAPLCLDMKIRDFGPIKKASISLRPLTVFIGPDNTGKSYAARLAHSIIAAGGAARMHSRPPAGTRGEAGRLEKLAGEVRRALADLRPGEPADCPPALASQIWRSCRRIFAERVRGEIERNFETPLSGLARLDSGRFFAALGGGGRAITCGSRGVRLSRMPAPRIRLEVARSARPGAVRVARLGGGALGCTVHRGLAKESNLPALRRACGELEREVLRASIPSLPAASRFFPSGRAGMPPAPGAMPQDRPAGAPRPQGADSDFVPHTAGTRPRPGQYRALGEMIERDVIGGRVGIEVPAGGVAPEMVYRSRPGPVLPVRLASSAVSGLAPLTMHLKHGCRRSDMLVIEEPEAHLHPRSQRLLGRHIVRLVKSGVSVMVTTHSAILLEVFSQCLQASELSPKSRKRVLGGEDVYLDEDEVAPHRFLTEQGGAAVVERIPMSADEGISQEEFIEVDHLMNIDNIWIEEHRN